MSDAAAERPDGIDGSALPGPFPVGVWAKGFQAFLRERPRVQIFGEVVNLRRSRAKVYFELRDGDGAAQCSIWANKLDALRLPEGALADGIQVVVAGGPDYYPGSRTASGSFSFDVTGLRVAGEGDLLAQLADLRRRLEAEGLFLPQQQLPRPSLPRTIGVVTGEGGKARDDVLAGLRRRGWGGRLVWAFAPVQDRRAAPAVTAALQDLAAIEEVDVIIVARGGGSLADLFAFSDETLCRTVALLRVPVIASVGHHTDRMLIDDVAAVSCSTPTHAAEAAVPRDIAAERIRTLREAQRARAPRPARGRRPRARAGAARARSRRPHRAAPPLAAPERARAARGSRPARRRAPRSLRDPGPGAEPQDPRERGPRSRGAPPRAREPRRWR